MSSEKGITCVTCPNYSVFLIVQTECYIFITLFCKIMSLMSSYYKPKS